MGIMTQVLEKMVGKVHFYVYVGKNVAAEVILEEDKHVTIIIKNPVLVIEMGIDAFLKRKADSGTLKKLKEAGYKFKVQYRGIKFGL